jgi:NAD(P)-dependent dehydrogenase (short-subunit alcohol dehydrogenase family)
MEFKDKVVLITGAGENTGAALARLFCEQGARVCINDISIRKLESQTERLRDMGHCNFLTIPADISDRRQVASMFEQISQKYEHLDILINNACDQGIGQVFEEMTPEEFLSVIHTNLFGTFLVSHHSVKLMLKQPSKGVIINMGSNVSTRAIHNRPSYVASKGGVDALTRSMAIDLGPKGIRVNMVAPGYIHTNRWEEISEDVKTRRHSNVPLGYEATAEQIASVVLFLASEDARYINGERIVVDGGCSAQHLPLDVDL